MRDVSTVYDVPRVTAYSTAQQVIVYVTSFLYYILLFKILNLADIGQISLLTATMAVFATLTQLALPVAATRFISSSLGSQDPQSAAAVAKICLRLILTVAIPTLALASLLSPWVGTFLFNNPNTASLLITTFTAGFLLDLTTLYGAYFLDLGLYAQVVYQNILYVSLSRGRGLLLARIGLGILGIQGSKARS